MSGGGLVSNQLIESPATQCTLLQYGEPVRLLPSLPIDSETDQYDNNNSITSSSVTFDSTASNLGTAALTFVDDDGTASLIPDSTGANGLSPAGWEIAVAIQSDGVLYPYGVFEIVTSTVSDTVDTSMGEISGDLGPTVQINATDRSFLASMYSTLDTSYIKSGTPLAAATVRLMKLAIPWLPAINYHLDDGGIVLPAQNLPAGTQVWSTLMTWWQSAGGFLYFDRGGNLVGDIYDPTGVPVDAFKRGDGRVTGFQPVFDASSAYNGVQVVGNNPAGIPVQATAWDTDPSSPTYYLGPFLQRLAPQVSSSTILTQQQAVLTAKALLPAYLGLSNTVEFSTLPNYLRWPWDIVEVDSAPDNISGLWQVQTIVTYLDYTASMDLTCVPAGRPATWGESPS